MKTSELALIIAEHDSVPPIKDAEEALLYYLPLLRLGGGAL